VLIVARDDTQQQVAWSSETLERHVRFIFQRRPLPLRQPFFHVQEPTVVKVGLKMWGNSNYDKKAQLVTRRHSKMAVRRHLGFYRTANSAIRSTDPQNPNLEPIMEWIGCTVCKIFALLYCDLETGVRGHSRSSKAALFDRAHTTLYSSSILTMPLSITVSKIHV